MKPYTSECAPYNIDPDFPDEQRAMVSVYTPVITNGDPIPFPISVTISNLTDSPHNYAVIFGTAESFFGYNISYFSNGSMMITTNPPEGIKLSVNGFINTITLGSVAADSTLKKGTYIIGDKYTLNLSAICGGIQAILERPALSTVFGGTINSNNNTSTPTPCTDCSCLVANSCKLINVPIVNILGQITVDYSDIGDVIFTICDRYQYYEEKNIVCNENKCTVNDYIQLKDLKQTKFHKCCPFIVSVLKGKGKTAKEKSDYLWDLNKTKLGIS